MYHIVCLHSPLLHGEVRISDNTICAGMGQNSADTANGTTLGKFGTHQPTFLFHVQPELDFTKLTMRSSKYLTLMLLSSLSSSSSETSYSSSSFSSSSSSVTLSSTFTVIYVVSMHPHGQLCHRLIIVVVVFVVNHHRHLLLIPPPLFSPS